MSLFDSGLIGPDVDAFAERVRGVAREQLLPLLADAEEHARFPRAAIEAIGTAGLLRERWSGGPHGDLGRAVVLSEVLGRTGLGGLAVGITVHGEAFTSILHRYGEGAELERLLDAALAGARVGCLATSELRHGSDIASVETTAAPEDGGWRVRGVKRYVSLGSIADVVLTLARIRRPGRRETLGVFLVSREQAEVRRPYLPSGARSLETVELAIDAHADGGCLLGRPGTGLLATTWGLTHERLAAAAQAIGGAQLAIDLAVSHMRRRRQFGQPLFDHQGLRLRIAALAAQVELARLGVRGIASSGSGGEAAFARRAAAAKVTCARLATRVAHECRHIFGGLGYLEGHTPLPRLSRDAEFARFGGGTDEMMWELVSGGLTGDDELYDATVQAPEAA